MPSTPAEHRPTYSPTIFCAQLHALYDLVDRRRQEILADPALNPDNDELMEELQLIGKRIALIRECFEAFCPS